MIRVVFFGSGAVAAEALNLLSQNFEIEAVVTKPKPVHHKGDFPVLKLAEANGFKVFEVQNKQDLTNLFKSQPVTSQIGIVIDYGVIISKEVIDYFPLGIVNSHFSLLPQWRGADPITFAILSGQTKTGVSLMLIDEHLDTGKLITQKKLEIKSEEYIDSLTNRLIQLSNQLLKDYLPRYVSGKVKPHNQPHPDRVTYSRKLTKADGIIDWNKSAEQIAREIRAFKDWPKSRTILAGKEVIITAAYATPSQAADSKPGDFEVLRPAKVINVATASGSLWIQRLKPAGKPEMAIDAFIAGYGKKLDSKS